MRNKRLLLLATIALVAAACGGDDDGDTTAAAADTTAAAAETTEGAVDTTAAEAADTTAEAADTTAEAVETTGDAADTTAAEAAGAYAELAAAEAGEYSGTTVEILAQWVDTEADNFENTMAAFAERTGIEIAYEGITDYETVLTVRVEGGDTPDLAQLAQPGLMREFAEAGALVELSEFIPLEQLEADYSPAWTDLTTFDGGIYGVYFKADSKSIVWYPIQAFEDNGYAVPTTYDELIALSDQIVADGNGNPWCVSMEHGDATGWVGTDWIEDTLLRQAPVEIYDQWVAHEIPFNAPEILAAAETVGSVWFAPDYVYGGSTAINSTFVGDTQNPMFDEAGPQCWLHKQAAWIPDFWPKDPATEEPLFEPGVDSGFFYFPTMDDSGERPVLGGGDMFVMFEDRPEVRAVMQYLATSDAARGWIESGGFVSPNSSVPLDWYTSYSTAGLAEILSSATVLRFDASDTMPAEVGAGTFWAGMVDWVAANGENTEEVFQSIEDSWPAEA